MGDLGAKTAFGQRKCSGVQRSSGDTQGQGPSLAWLGDTEVLRVGEDKEQGRGRTAWGSEECFGNREVLCKAP